MRGWSKRRVFESLWTNQLGVNAPDLNARIEQSYAEFRKLLERHYQTVVIEPTEGCLECFEWLRSEGIAIGLTTGFYRTVTDIILRRLGWDQGLDARRVGTADTIIQVSVCSDDVRSGRPAPDMIHRAMMLLGIADSSQVVKIGDTPSDVLAGQNAGCGLTLAVTNGSHKAAQLSAYRNDGLLSSLRQLKVRLLDVRKEAKE